MRTAWFYLWLFSDVHTQHLQMSCLCCKALKSFYLKYSISSFSKLYQFIEIKLQTCAWSLDFKSCPYIEWDFLLSWWLHIIWLFLSLYMDPYVYSRYELVWLILTLHEYISVACYIRLHSLEWKASQPTIYFLWSAERNQYGVTECNTF